MNALSCVYIPIRIDESASFGIVVPGVEVVKAGLLIIVVTPVAEGVEMTQSRGHRPGDKLRLAPCIICIFYYLVAVAVQEEAGMCKDYHQVVIDIT